MESGSLRAINYTIEKLYEGFFTTRKNFRIKEADGGRIGYSIGSEEAVGSEPLMKDPNKILLEKYNKYLVH